MREIEFLRHRHEVTQVPQFHPLTIVQTYASTKKQSIGRMPFPDLKRNQQMNANQNSTTETDPGNSTRTANTIAPLARKPIPANWDSPSHPIESRSNSEPARGSENPDGGPGRRLPRLRSVLLFCVALSTIAYFGLRYLAYSRSWVSTDNAYLAGHIHTISSRVGGNVKEVLVDENQTVTAGTVLARLDSAEFQVRRRQALAQVTQAAAQVQESQARIAQAGAQVTRERARATKARQDLDRASSLFEGGSGAISKQELDLARAEADGAEAALLGAGSALESATASAAAARAQEQVARASLEEAQLQLSYTEIVAPTAGRIGKKNLETGNHVQPGQALLALVQPEVWVTANFKETQLSHLRAGQTVRIKLDAFPGQTFPGTVEGVSPASGAQFALLPPDNATGNFTKIVQRIPVKILLDRSGLGEFGDRLVTGMSVLVEVNVHE
jgi:membrane fusion protein (multidrug efflux system)